MKVLFIGGVADGQRLDVPEGKDVISVPQTEPGYFVSDRVARTVASSVKFDRYRTENIIDRFGSAVTIRVCERLTTFDALRMLVDGYRKQ